MAPFGNHWARGTPVCDGRGCPPPTGRQRHPAQGEASCSCPPLNPRTFDPRFLKQPDLSRKPCSSSAPACLGQGGSFISCCSPPARNPHVLPFWASALQPFGFTIPRAGPEAERLLAPERSTNLFMSAQASADEDSVGLDGERRLWVVLAAW